jgi:hypothetical protein
MKKILGIVVLSLLLSGCYAKKSFDDLFQLGFVPFINENDTVLPTEINYGLGTKNTRIS